MYKLCMYCGRELKWVNGKGWVHAYYNSAYIMKCKDCGYEGESAVTCPNCGSKNYIDDHCASPDNS